MLIAHLGVSKTQRFYDFTNLAQIVCLSLPLELAINKCAIFISCANKEIVLQ